MRVFKSAGFAPRQRAEARVPSGRRSKIAIFALDLSGDLASLCASWGVTGERERESRELNGQGRTYS